MQRALTRLLALLGLIFLALLVPGTSSARRDQRRPRPFKGHHRHHHARVAEPVCADADTPPTAASAAAMRRAVLCLVNRERTSRGLPALRAKRALSASAQRWTNSMVSSGFFSHGADFSSRISAAGYVWVYAGENIASGFDTPRAVVRAWMGSRDHCRNILDPHYADVGSGVVPRPVGEDRGSSWTQDFGLRVGRALPSRDEDPRSRCPYD